MATDIPPEHRHACHAPPVSIVGERHETRVHSIFERDGYWYVAHCPEIPGANGQGQTKQEARDSLAAAIQLILDDRREDGLRGLPDDVEREILTLE